MPTIYDNIKKYLEEGLKKTLEKSVRADFCIGYFNLRGWRRIADEVEKLPGDYLPGDYEDDTKYHCRVLVGMQKMPEDELKDFLTGDCIVNMDNTKAIELKKKMARLFREQLTYGTPTNEDENALKQLSVKLKEKRVIVKLHLKHTLHAKLYLAFRDDYNNPVTGFVGSSNLTFSGISKQGELNVDVVEKDAAKKLATWFQNRWEDRWSVDISLELAEIIDESWASDKLHLPYHIYLKIAYHLSREARAGISEFNLSKIFEKTLLPYQQSAVKVAAHHLHKRGGVNGFRFGKELIDENKILELSEELIEDLKTNSQMLQRIQKNKGITVTQSFKISKSKPIIDQIDTVLAQHYGFTEEELDFIINYDIKYRMGKALFGEENGEEEEEED
jgi:hypothetical protein